MDNPVIENQMKSVYHYPEYAAIVGALDERVLRLHDCLLFKVRLLQDINSKIPEIIKKEENMDHIEVGLNMIAENKKAILDIREPVDLIKEIASYSLIIQLYEGNPKNNPVVLYAAFPNVIYVSNAIPPIQKEERITLADIAKASNAKGGLSGIFPDKGFPSYLVINPSRIMDQNFFAIFNKHIIETIKHEYSNQSGLSKKSFLWDMQRRIEYFRETHKGLLEGQAHSLG